MLNLKSCSRQELERLYGTIDSEVDGEVALALYNVMFNREELQFIPLHKMACLEELTKVVLEKLKLEIQGMRMTKEELSTMVIRKDDFPK